MPTYKLVWKQAKKNGLTGGMSLLDFLNKMRELGSTSGNDSIAKSYFYHTTPTVSKEEISDSIIPKFTLNNLTLPRFFNENDFLNLGILGLRLLSINRNSTPSTTVGTEIKQETPVVNTTQTPTSSAYWLNRAKQFGFNNIDEVKNWQREHGLTVDGLFGKNSEKKWNELNGFKESNTYSGHEDENLWKENPSSYTTTKNLDKWINFWDSTGIGPWLKRLFGIKKQGGKLMNYKYQQGGQVQLSSEQDAVMQFVQALAQTLQADPNQVILAAQLNPDALKSAVQVYQQTLDIQQAAQAFSQALQSQAQVAKHGAKLNYLKALKNQCAEDEELVYFKKGGKVDCGCVKKTQEGGKAPKKESPVMKFKKTIKSKDLAVKDSTKLDPKTTKTLPNGKYPSNWTADDKIIWEREHGPKDEGAHIAREQKCGGKMKKDCGGSKLKKGDKVCPKCGKVHAAGAGCMLSSVKKFKMHRLGGSLNGVPFMLQGTSKGGVQYRFRRSTNDMNNGYKTYSDLIMMTLDPLGRPTYDTPPISAGRIIYVTPLGNDTIFYTNNDYIFNKTPKGDLNLKKAKLKFYQLIKKSPIEGEEYRMTPYWNSNHINLDMVRNRALKGN